MLKIEKNLKLIPGHIISKHSSARDSLREAFRIEYDPDTRQFKIIPEEKAVEIDALPPEERRKIKTRLHTVYEEIKEMEQTQSPVRDDKLYDALYEEHGISRLDVTQRLAMLVKNGSVSSPRPGYYMTTLRAARTI